MKRISIFILCIILIVPTLTAININDTTTLQRNTVLIVDNEGDGDFTTIQDAIYDARSGDTIKVYSGIYQELITISDKSFDLIGIDKELGNGNDVGKPIIDGHGLDVRRSNVNISGFIIKNSRIEIWHGYCIISNNDIINNNYNSNGIDLIRSDNCTIVKNNMINNNAENICLVDSINVTICNNNIDGGRIGIRIWDSNYNNIHNNIISNSREDLIFLENSSNNIIDNNKIYNSTKEGGISLEHSSNNIIKNNDINIDYSCIMISDLSHNNIIEKNDITNSGYGIYFDVHYDNYNSSFNIIKENYIFDNDIGIFVSSSNNNTFYHNYFFDNRFKNAEDDGLYNIWDDGSEGNEWDDYDGTDLDGDGIGDTPYNISGDGNSKDRYPLIGPAPPPTFPEIGKISGGIGKVSVEIKCFGVRDIYNVKCSIQVEGGIFGRLYAFDECIIPEIKSGEMEIIETKIPIGLGPIQIYVTAEDDWLSDEKVVDGRIFFVFISINSDD